MRRLGLWASAAASSPWPQVLARAFAKIGLEFQYLNERELVSVARRSVHIREMRIIETALRDAGLGEGTAFWASLAGKMAIEVGCGRFGGLGPACVVAQASGYVGVDPGVAPALFRRRAVVAGLIGPALEACARHVGTDPGIGSVQQFDSRARYVSGGIESLDLADPADVALSISCLEHIDDMQAAIGTLVQCMRANATHLHLVNFGNHTNKDAPFAGLYEMPREAYLDRWGAHINGLRLPDVLAVFKQHGVDARAHVLDAQPEALPQSVHEWWSARYSSDDLAVRTALVVAGTVS